MKSHGAGHVDRSARHAGGAGRHAAGAARPTAGATRHSADAARHAGGSARHSADAARHVAGSARHVAGPGRHSAGPGRHVAGAARPAGRPTMYMTWSNLAFLHFRVPADALRPQVPSGLEIDTFDGTAWLGLVPFTMHGVRHAGWPRVPTLHRFHECNVRTYVTAPDGEPGVWFFSLDAASRLAVWGGRRFWGLNYVHSKIDFSRSGAVTEYAVRRIADPGTTMQCAWEMGGELPRSEPGSLEHFLTERYALYCGSRARGLRRGRIWHEPWPLREARLHCLDGELVRVAAGVERGVLDVPAHCLHAESLAVEAWRLLRV